MIAPEAEEFYQATFGYFTDYIMRTYSEDEEQLNLARGFLGLVMAKEGPDQEYSLSRLARIFDSNAAQLNQRIAGIYQVSPYAASGVSQGDKSFEP